MSDASHVTPIRGAVRRSAAINAVVAIAAAVLSFHAQADLAHMTGVFPGWLPVLWPLVVDAFMLQASLSLVVAAGAHDPSARRYHWIMLAIASTVSLAANFYHAIVVAHGVLPAIVSASIAIVPPLFLLFSTHGLIVHLSRPPSAHGAHTQVTPLPEGHSLTYNETGSVRDVLDDGGAVRVDDSAVHVPHDVTPATVNITEEHQSLARRVKSEKRIKTTEDDVALVLALADAGYTAKDIADWRPDIGVRTTIARWLGAADHFRSADRAQRPQEARTVLTHTPALSGSAQ